MAAAMSACHVHSVRLVRREDVGQNLLHCLVPTHKVKPLLREEHARPRWSHSMKLVTFALDYRPVPRSLIPKTPRIMCCQATEDGYNEGQSVVTTAGPELTKKGENLCSDAFERETLQLDRLAREQMHSRAAVEESLLTASEAPDLAEFLPLFSAQKGETVSHELEAEGGAGQTANSQGSEVLSGQVEVPAGAWKWIIRKSIWDHLESENLAAPPRPVHHRIPNFVGAQQAAEMVASLPEFASADVVKVNPDTPQKRLRYLVLSGGKTMITPQPRLRTGFFSKLDPSQLLAEDWATACTARGAAKLSSPVGLLDKIKVDLLVIGSVAVDPSTGARLGKGEGFAELEYGMLRWMGAIDDSTLVVTSVHDSQLVGSIPLEKLPVHDLPVDIICTPTQTIRVANSPIPKPTGIYWDKLSPQKLSAIRILQELKAQIEKETGEKLPTGPPEELPPSAKRTRRRKQAGQDSSESRSGNDTRGATKANEGSLSKRDARWMKSPVRLFVRNLARETTWQDLATLFEESAGVRPIMVDMVVREGRNVVARVALRKKVDVDAVIDAVGGAELLGRRVIVRRDDFTAVVKNRRGSPSRRAIDHPTRVFVRGLHRNTSKGELLAAFARAGVEPVAVELLLLAGRPRGMARVALEDDADVPGVLALVNGMQVDGSTLAVQEDKPGVKGQAKEVATGEGTTEEVEAGKELTSTKEGPGEGGRESTSES